MPLALGAALTEDYLGVAEDCASPFDADAVQCLGQCQRMAEPWRPTRLAMPRRESCADGIQALLPALRVACAIGPVRLIQVRTQLPAKDRLAAVVPDGLQGGLERSASAGQQDMFADPRGGAAIVGQPVQTFETAGLALLAPLLGGQEQLAATRLFIVQRQYQRSEYEVEQAHGAGDFPHQQGAAGLEQRT